MIYVTKLLPDNIEQAITWQKNIAKVVIVCKAAVLSAFTASGSFMASDNSLY